MSLSKHLLRLFTGISKVWPLAISLCASSWNNLLAFLSWQPIKAAAALAKDEIPGAAPEKKPQGRPNVIRYIGLPEASRIPDTVPYGTIYYPQKGTYAGFGMTAHIELAPEGHVVKTPKTNPYNLQAQERNMADMRTEAAVYGRIGHNCPYIPKMVAWDPKTCCLSLEYLENGALAEYMEENALEIEAALRRRWALQATRGLRALHAVGIIHGDLTPRNVLLGADNNVRVADFAGSCIDGASYKICAGERYIIPGWSFNKKPEPADDIFLLGGLIYFIMTSKEPHHDLESAFDVAKQYNAGVFPDVAGLDCGAVIQGCWKGSLGSADEVLVQLLRVFGTDEDPLSDIIA
ncbi:hypothetical protein F503_03166 [Ophiostoma piceae UAMH 11346]|uniref:EKC/KEOPS complex subunit BUD32 n=1 Tax=Ophiostoma piceae (strain UAMH 11346) TaxID=1262450 RepID=S3BZQ2_OPHP1|nr:hypothetical protein F503_03166 [Ophiostoma piceae UAMH 11346]